MTKRFLTPFLHPSGNGFASGDANLYRYVNNEPTNWLDPTGLAYGGSGWENEQGIGAETPGFWDGIKTGIGTIGQAGWAPFRFLGITDLVGIEDTLQAAEDRLDHHQNRLSHKDDPVGQGFITAGEFGANVGVAATYGAVILRSGQAITGVRVELHGTHGHALPHLQAIKGPGWGKTIGRLPPHSWTPNWFKNLLK